MEKQSTRKFLKLIVALVAFFLIGAAALMLASCKEEHVHDFGEGVVTTNPTCTQTGVRTFTCSCGEVQYATEPVLGHDWNDPVTVDATCAKPGSITRTCARCNEVETTIIPATGAHTPSDTPDPKLSVAPTCASAGTNVYTCTVCGAVTATVTVPATGNHSWDEGKVYPASCESQGYTHYTCTVCGLTDDRDYVDKLNHVYTKLDENGDVVIDDETGKPVMNVVSSKPATCLSDGYIIYACIYCEQRYTETISALNPAKGDHTWIENTDATDTSVTADQKKDGWTTVTAPTCLKAGVMERTCQLCGVVEKDTIAATGHKAPAGANTAACYINTSLVDANGKTLYSYECQNPNCDAELVTGQDGEQHHWIPATAEHEWGEWTTTTPVSCEDDGEQERECKVCGTKETKTLETSGHAWNTIQLDGKTEVVPCEGDPMLTKTAYLNAMFESLGAEEYAEKRADLEAAWDKANSESEGRGVSRFCSVCGAVEGATGHNYIVSKLKDGMYGFNDYEVDPETGLPVDSGVSVADMDCRYVQVCANGCGRVLARGQHGETTAATCRNPATCTVCGEPLSQLLPHEYQTVETILEYANSNDAAKKAIYNAYVTVSATETWMKEVVGSCDTPSTEVQLCVNCLLAAAKGEETVTWNKSETTLEASNPIYNASVVNIPAKHSYVAAYYRLTATSLDAGKIVYEQTNCNVGFKIAYICEKCGDVYMNVPVGNTTATSNEAAANVAADNPNTIYKLGYTDSIGFVLDLTDPDADQAGDPYDMSTITADQVAQLQAEDHIGAHSLYLLPEYQKTNGYLASTCATLAEIPYVCEHCGATIVLSANVKDDTGSDFDFVIVAATEENGYGTIADADTKYDADNHAAETFACGEHCKAVDENGNYICAALVADWKKLDSGVNTTEYVPATDAFVADTAHASVTIEYGFTTSVKYFKDYTIMIATVPETAITGTNDEHIDFTKATLSATTKVTLCLDNSTYKLPLTVKDSGNTKGDYLVLVKDGKVYGVKSYNLYTQDDGAQSGELTNDTKVTQDDKFFVGFDNENSTATDAPITAVDPTSLTKAFAGTPVEQADGTSLLTVNVGADISVTALPEFAEADKIVVNLNEHELEISTKSSTTLTGNVTFNNGAITYTAKVSGDYAMTVGGLDSNVTFNNIDLTTESGSGILLCTPGYPGNGVVGEESAVVTIKDSNIVSYGYYGIGTNASNADADQDPITLTIENSTVTMNPDNGTSTAATDNTAVFINVPANVKISGCEFSANRQVLVMRGGTLDMSDTVLNMKGEFDQYEVVEKDATTGQYNFSSLGNTAISTIKAYDANYTLQDYRMSGLWSSGNELPSAAMVIGHSGTGTSYQYKSTVTLGEGVVFNIDNPEAPAVVIGSYYDDATIGEGTTMVSLTAASSIGLSTENVKVCWNWIKDTIAFSGVQGYPAVY